VTEYRIKINGHLDQRWERVFPGFSIIHQLQKEVGPITLVIGEVHDQAALYGMITRLRNMGAELISVQPKNDGINEGKE